MDAAEVVTIIGAIGSVILTPTLGVVTIWINTKFNAKLAEKDAQIASLNTRLDACEKRHRDNDAEKADALARVHGEDRR